MISRQSFIAAVLAVAQILLGLFWTLGGPGFPFAETEEAMHAGAILIGLDERPAAGAIAALGVLALVAVLRRAPRVCWGLSALAIVLVPDARILVATANLLMANLDPFNAAIGYQFLTLATAWALGSAAASSSRSRAGTRVRTSVPSWERHAVTVAVTAPLIYTATRWAWAAGIHLGVDSEFLRQGDYDGAGARTAEFILGAMAAGGALLTLGLARRWGSVFPRWIPFLRGRRVPVWLAVVPATAVAGILTAAGLAINRGFIAMHLGWTPMEPVAKAENWGAWFPPLLWLAWGLALGAATIAYRRRRQAPETTPAKAGRTSFGRWPGSG